MTWQTVRSLSRSMATTCGCLALTLSMAAVGADREDPRHPLAAALVGSWSGTLEYRDYSTDRRVTLPTTLVVASREGAALTLDYTYDEGRGRFVRSSQVVTITAAPPTYRVQSSDGTNDTTFDASGLSEVRDGTGTVVLRGRGRENDRDVELRTTVTVTPKTLTMRRDSRRPDEDWQFRNQYSFTR